MSGTSATVLGDHASSAEGDQREDDAHPEGPNIGFGSDPSWLSKVNKDFRKFCIL
jgi:hypothetical protein